MAGAVKDEDTRWLAGSQRSRASGGKRSSCLELESEAMAEGKVDGVTHTPVTISVKQITLHRVLNVSRRDLKSTENVELPKQETRKGVFNLAEM